MPSRALGPGARRALTQGTANPGGGVGLAVALGAVGDVPVAAEERPHHGCCSAAPRRPRAAAIRSRETSGRREICNKRATLLSAADTDTHRQPERLEGRKGDKKQKSIEGGFGQFGGLGFFGGHILDAQGSLRTQSITPARAQGCQESDLGWGRARQAPDLITVPFCFFGGGIWGSLPLTLRGSSWLCV